MEVKLNSKLLQAANGLMLFAIAIILMACDIDKLGKLHWLLGLFLLLGGGALCGAWFMEGRKNLTSAAVAGLYGLFGMVFLAKSGIAMEPYFFILWIMIEGTFIALAGLKQREENADLWYVQAGLGALILLLGFITCFVAKSSIELFVETFAGAFGSAFGGGKAAGPKMSFLIGFDMILVALGQFVPFCMDFLPKKK